jgi:hypothetical protein
VGGADTCLPVSAIPRSGTLLLVFIPLDPLPTLLRLGNAFFILHQSEFIILFALLSYADRRYQKSTSAPAPWPRPVSFPLTPLPWGEGVTTWRDG